MNKSGKKGHQIFCASPINYYMDQTHHRCVQWCPFLITSPSHHCQGGSHMPMHDLAGCLGDTSSGISCSDSSVRAYIQVTTFVEVLLFGRYILRTVLEVRLVYLKVSENCYSNLKQMQHGNFSPYHVNVLLCMSPKQFDIGCLRENYRSGEW